MSDENQSSVASVTLVGMDAHTRVLSLCIVEWRHGSDPRIIRNIPNVLFEDMEKVYERWIPKDALTLVESSGNTRVIVNRLKAIDRKTEVLNADISRRSRASCKHEPRQPALRVALARLIFTTRPLSACRSKGFL